MAKRWLSLMVVAAFMLLVAPAPAEPPGLASEIPAKFKPQTGAYEYERREVMIPMRDGVKLHTVILVPKGATRAPMLLTRTPYDATKLTTHIESPHLASALEGYDNATDVIVDGGYIRVVQDVRGKYGSQGSYIMNRPLRGPLNPTAVDHATDTFDTIDWLVKHVHESNGRVGILGISYDGFTPLMALVHPHPALKVSVPMNPMVDGWRGDDWFHNGAFRMFSLPYIYEQESGRANPGTWWNGAYDDFDVYARGNVDTIARMHGVDQMGMWRKIEAHPAYDAFWQQQAVDQLLRKEPLRVPVMLVDGLWDQEDIYGAPAVYRALKPLDTAGDKVFLTIGPWYHGQEIDDGSTLGALSFKSDTARWWRRNVLAPFLAHYLKDDAPPMDVAPVTAFETGTNEWRRLPAWPAGCASGCTIVRKSLYLHANQRASFVPPATAEARYDAYVSDPMHPVTFRQRPIHLNASNGSPWHAWLVDDQRDVATRPDVLSFATDVLTAPVKISGPPAVDLIASTTGSDSDWVVKLIDVYPDEVADDEKLGGHELMIAADILRGRYRESLSVAEPITPNQPLAFRWNLPQTNHVFLPGHRIMVQVQSTWFPLYERNPQTFVPNIFRAPASSYRTAEQHIYHTPGDASAIVLPVVTVN